MSGTIFNITVESGHENDLLDIIGSSTSDVVFGWLLMRLYDRNKDLFGVALFESKEAYTTTVNGYEQHDVFTNIVEHLLEEPIWTDGEYNAWQMV